MTLQMPTDPEERGKVSRMMKAQRAPYITITQFAGWEIFLLEQYKVGEEHRFDWIAANKSSGQLLSFGTEDDEPEPCYESAAEKLVFHIQKELD